MGKNYCSLGRRVVALLLCRWSIPEFYVALYAFRGLREKEKTKAPLMMF